MLLDADPNVNDAIERAYITTPNNEVAYRCMLILIDAARKDALAEMTRLIDLRPALATDDFGIELRRQLEEDNFFRLWL